MVKKLSDLYLDVRRVVSQSEDPQTASLMARSLLCHYTGKSQEQILAERDHYVGDDICSAVEAGVKRLLAGEPLAYILQEWDFYGMRLHVNPNVLIPRDDTCAVTAMAIKKALFLNQDPRILDLCTGSGCIGLAVAQRVKDARVTLADVSQEALAVAKRNVVSLKLSGRVSCIHADALADPAPFLGKFDMIISNPPYIRHDVIAELEPEVRDHEPMMALDGGEDGLDFYRQIVDEAPDFLKKEGIVMVEIGHDQMSDIIKLFSLDDRYSYVTGLKDLAGRDRIVVAILSPKKK